MSPSRACVKPPRLVELGYKAGRPAPSPQEDEMRDFIVTVGFHNERDDVAVVVSADSIEAAQEKAFLHFMEESVAFTEAMTVQDFEQDFGRYVPGMFDRV
jgi:hypothetical protein